jgi:plastocyanin
MTTLTVRSAFALAAAVIAMLTVVQPASTRADPQARASASADRVSGKEYSFKLAARSIRKPGKVTFSFRNVGQLVHNFHINGKGTRDVQPGTSATLTVTFKRKGSYRYLCTEPGHAALGMRGVFTVR